MEDIFIVIKVYPTFIKSLSFILQKIVDEKVYQRNDPTFIICLPLGIIYHFLKDNKIIFEIVKNFPSVLEFHL